MSFCSIIGWIVSEATFAISSNFPFSVNCSILSCFCLSNSSLVNGFLSKESIWFLVSLSGNIFLFCSTAFRLSTIKRLASFGIISCFVFKLFLTLKATRIFELILNKSNCSLKNCWSFFSKVIFSKIAFNSLSNEWR